LVERALYYKRGTNRNSASLTRIGAVRRTRNISGLLELLHVAVKILMLTDRNEIYVVPLNVDGMCHEPPVILCLEFFHPDLTQRPSLLTPLVFDRTWFAWCIISVLSQRTRCWMASSVFNRRAAVVSASPKAAPSRVVIAVSYVNSAP